MPPILEVKQLSIFAGSKQLVKNASFTLHTGECLALIGESGSGKTTIAQSILQLHTHTAQGEILFEERNLLGLTEKEMQNIRAKKIGMIFKIQPPPSTPP